MGQQQLILLVLGIVIVGLAVTVGIQAFSENSKKANMDALVDDTIDFATTAQTWMLKPSIYGGGNNSCRTTCDWSSVTLSHLGYAESGGAYTNVNGSFIVDGSAGTQLVITGTSAAHGNQVTITVTGTAPPDISSSVNADYSS